MKNALRKVSAVLLTIVIAVSAISNTNLNSVQADTVLTSPLISVEGYQIKTDVSSNQGISFRTVCKAPSKGSVITIEDKKYTVKKLGVAFVKDPNRNGNHNNNVLSKAYTLLNPIPYFQQGKEKNVEFTYIGKTAYKGTYLTFGYIATDKGIIAEQDGYTSYVRTMTGMDAYMINSLHIRAFVEATDEEGNNVLIYGESASLTSVASIAYRVYNNGQAPDEEGHKYLYNTILNKLPSSSPYYMNTPIEYGWGEIVKP